MVRSCYSWPSSFSFAEGNAAKPPVVITPTLQWVKLCGSGRMSTKVTMIKMPISGHSYALPRLKAVGMSMILSSVAPEVPPMVREIRHPLPVSSMRPAIRANLLVPLASRWPMRRKTRFHLPDGGISFRANSLPDCLLIYLRTPSPTRRQTLILIHRFCNRPLSFSMPLKVLEDHY